MSRSARSVFVFGGYLAVLGATLVVVPNVLLRVFAVAATTEVWIRVVGVLVLCLAFLYLQAARLGLAEFFRWTLVTRGIVFVSLGSLAALGLAEPPLALFGTVDLLGAVWTGRCLHGERAGAA